MAPAIPLVAHRRDKAAGRTRLVFVKEDGLVLPTSRVLAASAVACGRTPSIQRRMHAIRLARPASPDGNRGKNSKDQERRSGVRRYRRETPGVVQRARRRQKGEFLLAKQNWWW